MVPGCRTMACPLPSSFERSSFEGRAQARCGLFNTEGPASMARRLHAHPMRSSFVVAPLKPAPVQAKAGAGNASADAAAPIEGAEGDAPVQTRFSIVEAVPLPHVVSLPAESAQAAADDA
jgi:hypothetical protein